MIVRVNTQRNRALALLCGLALVALGLDAWQRAAQRAGGHMWFDDLVCAVASPVQGVLLQASRRAEAAWVAIAHGRRLTEENARLSAEVAHLRATLNVLEESHATADRERALRAAYAGVRGQQHTARVIGVGAGGWLSYLVIDSGTAEGTQLRDVAVTQEGVIGQVYAVTSHTARVLPITDPASGFAVRAQRTRETGILKGAGRRGCEIRYLGPDSQLEPGDKLLTAGLGGVFPRGLPVGVVTAVSHDPSTSGKRAVVKPAARLGKVEEVLLVRAPPAQK